MTKLFVWRSSSRINGRCRYCHAKIRNKDLTPTNNVGIDANKANAAEAEMWCLSCRKVGIPTIVGVCRLIEDFDIPDDLRKEMMGMNVEDAIKKMAKETSIASDQNRKTDELITRIKQLEFQNGMLKGNLENANMMKNKEIAKRDKRIQELTKELEILEHRYDKLAERMMMHED